MKKFFRKKYLIEAAIYLALFVVVVVIIAQIRKPAEETNTDPKVSGVQVATVARQNEIHVPLKLTGQVKARQSTTIRSLVQGTLLSMVPVNSKVSKSSELFRLSNSSIEASYISALTSLSNAQNNLFETQVSSQSVLAQAELTLAQAEAGLELTERQLDDAIRTGELQKKQARDSAVVAYDNGYSTADQAMRYLGGANVSDYTFKSILTANQTLQVQAENQFTLAKIGYDRLSVTAVDLRADLSRLENALREIKELNTLTSTLLNYAVSGNGLSASDIVVIRAQVSVFANLLNSADGTVKSALNGLDNIDLQVENTIANLQKQVEISGLQVSNAQNAVSSQKSVAQLQKLGSSTQLSAASAQFAAAKFQYDNLALPAPFAGTVISHQAVAGSQVSPGQEILEMGDLNAVEIRVDVASTNAGALQLGQTVIINNNLQGRISEIEAAADLSTGKVGLKIEADNSLGQFVPGSIAEVEITLVFNTVGIIAIPLRIVEVGQNSRTVLVISGDKVEQRQVQLGRVFGDLVEITAGLSESDQVIINDGEFLETGDDIRIIGN